MLSSFHRPTAKMNIFFNISILSVSQRACLKMKRLHHSNHVPQTNKARNASLNPHNIYDCQSDEQHL